MQAFSKTILIALFSLTMRRAAIAQNSFLKANETVLFSFKATNGKRVMLALDKSKKYIVYRYGSAGHIELEYPKDRDNSFQKFKRYYYSRGFGAANAGTSLNQVEFTNGDYTYEIYEQFWALKHGERPEIGLTLFNNKTNKRIRIIGIVRSQKGTLRDLEDQDIIQLSHEAFGH